MVLLWYQGVQRLTLGLHPFALLLAGLQLGRLMRELLDEDGWHGVRERSSDALIHGLSLSGWLPHAAVHRSSKGGSFHLFSDRLRSFEAFTELQGLLALASQLLAALRWKLSDNVLPAFDAVPSDRCAAAVVLAANQAVACAMATLELSMFDLPGFLAKATRLAAIYFITFHYISHIMLL